MKISVHEVKDQVDVSIVLCPDHILESDDVLVAIQLLQENDLSKRALCVCCVLESVKVLL